MTSSYQPPATTNLEAPAPVPKVKAAVVTRNPRSPSGPPSPEMEATAEALTREEVLRRRRRRAARLLAAYRRLYWAMAEEVRAQHRQYVWELGCSPLEAEQPAAGPEAKPGPAAVPRRKKCGVTGCKVRAMAMAKYCHYHILSDPNHDQEWCPDWEKYSQHAHPESISSLPLQCSLAKISEEYITSLQDSWL